MARPRCGASDAAATEARGGAGDPIAASGLRVACAGQGTLTIVRVGRVGGPQVLWGYGCRHACRIAARPENDARPVLSGRVGRGRGSSPTAINFRSVLYNII